MLLDPCPSPLAPDEYTRDELKRFGLTMLQPRDGYRFTVDPLLLSDFAGVRDEKKIADLGTGCGVIALIIASMLPKAEVFAVEQDSKMSLLAQENAGLNGLGSRVRVINDDVLNLKSYLPVSSCDLVVSNPPYRKAGMGRLSPDPGRLAGRHETTAQLADFLAAAKYLVKPSGRICMVYHIDRLSDLMVEAQKQKLTLIRLRMVHGLPELPAKLFLVELAKGSKNSALQVMPQLIVRRDTENYTDELKAMLSV